MAFPQHPLRPLGSALHAVLSPLTNLHLLLPFVLLGILKALFLAALLRPDYVPSYLLAPLLKWFPEAESYVRYPQLVLRLPEVARWLDIGCDRYQRGRLCEPDAGLDDD